MATRLRDIAKDLNLSTMTISKVLRGQTDVSAETKARVLKRMHVEKQLSITLSLSSGLIFRGEREDLEEMAGNLIDNACKWAESAIAVEAGPLPGGGFPQSLRTRRARAFRNP